MQAKIHQSIGNHGFVGFREIKNDDSQTPIFQVSNPETKKVNVKTKSKNIRPTKMKKTKKVRSPEQIDHQILNLDCERQKKQKIVINTRQIFTYFPTYTTIDQKMQSKELKQQWFVFDDQEELRNKRINLIRDEEKIIYQRKKLAPIRKGSNVQTRKVPSKKNLNLSFLNIEKVPCISLTSQSEDEKNKMIMTSSLFNKKGAFFGRQSYDQRTQTIDETRLALTSNKFFKPDFMPKLTRYNKPFTIPFERYYYHDFVWKVAFSNKIKPYFVESYVKKFKVFIGRGNNSMLIRTLMNRREAWWSLTEKMEEANLIWTQLKVNQIFNCQENGEEKIDKAEEEINEKRKNSTNYKLNKKIMNELETEKWLNYFEKFRDQEQKMNPSMLRRNKLIKQPQSVFIHHENIKIHNHLPQNYMLGNKKALFYTMSNYYSSLNEETFSYLPLTFHIQDGLDDPQYVRFLKMYYEKAKLAKSDANDSQKIKKMRNIWIIKPGQYTNRGNGIRVCLSLDQIKKILKQKQKHENGNRKTYIVQAYIDRPFLYHRRKFDIRHFMMITSINGSIKGYWYEVGYIRTTSFDYTVKNNYTSVHLTNDAVQKSLPEYGKYQKGNKLSYDEFEKYLKREFQGRHSFYEQVYPKMKKIAIDSIKASARILDPERKKYNFQIFGFDFMIDADFHPWLIEINTNPCLQLSSPILLQIIPPMIENALKIAVDCLIPPPAHFAEKRPKFNNNVLEQNKFELVFDSGVEEEWCSSMQNETQRKLDCKELQKEADEVYEDDGVQFDY